MAIKRRATSADASADVPNVVKKPLTAKAHITKQCNLVATAVNAATGYPQSVRNIVGGNLLDCLGVPKEDRHPFHQQLIGMVGEVLSSVESSINEKVSAAESSLSSANSEKETRDAAHDAAKRDLVAKNDALTAAKAEVQDSSAILKAAKTRLSEAQAASDEASAKLDAATKKKARLEFALSDGFAPLAEGSVSGQVAKSKIATVLKAAKECALDPSLLSSLPATLGRPAEGRGTFDSLVCQQVKAGLQSVLARVESDLGSSSAETVERAQAVEAAQVALAEAQDKEATCKAAAEQSKQEAEVAKAKEKASSLLVSEFGHDLNQTRKQLTVARAELEAFLGGAMAAYKDLMEYTTVMAPPLEQPETSAGSIATN